MTVSVERLLKQKRLEKKLTLNDVTRDLKIRKDYIRQCETKIPESLGVYELGYLRSYAKYLDVSIHDYVANLKARASAAASEAKTKSENKIFSKIKTSSGTLTIAFSIVGVLVSIVFLVVMNKGYFKSSNEKPSGRLISGSTNSDAINISASFSVKQRGPYDYLVSGIGKNAGVNIVARTNTAFTMIDPARNKVISSGAIRVGERLFIPKDQGNKIFISLLIKTNVPDAFEIQKNMQGK